LQRTSRTANCPAWFQVATLIAVENRCHWSLDVTYREDESRIRAQHLRENFAWLNRLTLSLLKQHPSRKSLAMKRRSWGWSDHFVREVLTSAKL